jgi:hypothetical protein
MSDYLNKRENCLIGKKAILPIFERMYDIHTWQGVKYFLSKHPFPMRKTPTNRPMILLHELIQYDAKFQEIIK